MARIGPRRPRGSGTVYPRTDGRAGYIARLPVPGGSVKRSFATEEAGRSWLDSQQPIDQRLGKAGDGTLGAWLEEWLKNPGTRKYRRRDARVVGSITGDKGQLVSDKTRATYRSLVRGHWLSHPIARRPLAAVTTVDIVRVLDEWDAAGKPGKTTIAHLRRILSAAFTAAAEQGLVAANPVSSTGFRSSDSNRVERLKLDESVARDVEAATKGTDLWPLVVLMLNTGLRLGEALALHWEDVQIYAEASEPGAKREPGQLTVRRALLQSNEHGKLEWYVGEPKTRRSRRTVGFDQDLVRPLFKLRTDSGSPKRGLLFHAAGFPDKPLNPQTVSKRFSAMLAAHEVELADPQPGRPPRSMITIRDLRSLHASIQVYRGAPISVVSRHLGHSDPATTLRRYIGVSTKADQELSRQSGLYHRVAAPVSHDEDDE